MSFTENPPERRYRNVNRKAEGRSQFLQVFSEAPMTTLKIPRLINSPILNDLHTGKDDFLNSCSILMYRMFAQGGKLNRTRKSLVRLYGKHQQLFEQFFDSLTAFLVKLLPIES